MNALVLFSVYNTTRHSESESLCILQVASRKDGATVCGQKNLSDFCEKLGADISKVELDRDSNFTIFWNQKLLVMDHYKGNYGVACKVSKGLYKQQILRAACAFVYA